MVKKRVAAAQTLVMILWKVNDSTKTGRRRS